MGDTLETVADGMSVVVQGVDAPFISHVRMRVEFNTIYHRVSQGCVSVVRVDTCAQGVGALLMQTQSHFFEDF